MSRVGLKPSPEVGLALRTPSRGPAAVPRATASTPSGLTPWVSVPLLGTG